MSDPSSASFGRDVVSFGPGGVGYGTSAAPLPPHSFTATNFGGEEFPEAVTPTGDLGGVAYDRVPDQADHSAA